MLLVCLNELTRGPRALQLTFLPQITTWAQQQEQLGLRLDLGRTAVVGHSRGGQLAALHLGEGRWATAAAMHAQVARHAHFFAETSVQACLQQSLDNLLATSAAGAPGRRACRMPSDGSL